MSSDKSRIFGLDLLRAIAIALVVISHCTYLVAPETSSAVITILRVFGAIGVDLFFVLSGFLIGGILLKLLLFKKLTFSDLIFFWKRRWLRTLPNYFLLLLLNVLLLLFLGENLPVRLWEYLVFIQNLTATHPNFFTEAWSLSIEEYAYILLPLLIFICALLFKDTLRKKLFLYATLFSLFVLFLLKISYYSTAEINSYSEWSASFRKIVIYRLDAIYIGFLVIYVTRFKNNIIQTYSKGLAFTGVLLFFVLHAIVYQFKIVPQTHLAFYVFVYLQVVLISLGMLLPYFSTLNYNGIFRNTVEFISKRSYAIYVINYSFVLLTLKKIFEAEDLAVYQNVGIVVLYLSITILLSSVVYRYFELPILRFRNKKYPSRNEK